MGKPRKSRLAVGIPERVFVVCRFRKRVRARSVATPAKSRPLAEVVTKLVSATSHGPTENSEP
jgi:hypothetical protein